MCHKVIKDKYMLSKSQIKYIQSLGHKKFRDETGLFIAEGPKTVLELVSAIPQNIVTVFAVEKWINENIKLNESLNIVKIDEAELKRISQLPAPNLVLAIVKKLDIVEIDTAGHLTIVLDTIQDPGNLGTIIRIADWFGVKQIVASRESADLYNSKVVQSTMGSIARVSVLYTDLKEWIGKQKVRILASALDGRKINEIGRITEGILIIGNESKGIDTALMEMATEKITIPKTGKAESLNAAVATGIILSGITN
jgi:RNA methyltransferase, TrmH family